VRVDRFPDLTSAAEAASEHIAAALARGVEARGEASFVATGGRTPGPIYERLALKPLDWPRIVVTLSDERWVDEDSAESNARLVRSLLLTGPAMAARFLSLKAPGDTPQAGLTAVRDRLSEIAGPFDCVLLGMGDDGHVASLFPANAGLDKGLDPFNPEPCVAISTGPDGMPPLQPRMSLTARRLNDARQIVIFITGPSKAEALERAQAGSDPLEAPVRAVLNGPADVRVIWSP